VRELKGYANMKAAPQVQNNSDAETRRHGDTESEAFSASRLPRVSSPQRLRVFLCWMSTVGCWAFGFLFVARAQTTPRPTPSSLLQRATPSSLLAPRATPSSLLLPRTTPAGSPAAPGAQTPSPPPRDIPVVEKKWETLANTDVTENGKIALEIAPQKWKHAETDNFILHYRRVTEAQKVAREVEYDLWFVATTLGATKDRYTRKSHVFVFEDDDEWKEFLGRTKVPSWASSFAFGDELFLNVRRAGDTGRFNSSTLAHETTHAVVARLFPGKRWPLWLNEGFAEYMGGASVATRKGQSLKRYQANLSMAEMPLTTMESLREYPPDEEAVAQLYQTSEKFVRFLMNELPKDRIVQFIDAILAGKSMQDAVLAVYSDKFKDWPEFVKKYERFTK